MKFLLALRREVFALHAKTPQHLRAPVPIPGSPWEQRGKDSLLRHGQGCGNDCGCVCDLEVNSYSGFMCMYVLPLCLPL